MKKVMFIDKCISNSLNKEYENLQVNKVPFEKMYYEFEREPSKNYFIKKPYYINYFKKISILAMLVLSLSFVGIISLSPQAKAMVLKLTGFYKVQNSYGETYFKLVKSDAGYEKIEISRDEYNELQSHENSDLSSSISSNSVESLSTNDYYSFKKVKSNINLELYLPSYLPNECKPLKYSVSKDSKTGNLVSITAFYSRFFIKICNNYLPPFSEFNKEVEVNGNKTKLYEYPIQMVENVTNASNTLKIGYALLLNYKGLNYLISQDSYLNTEFGEILTLSEMLKVAQSLKVAEELSTELINPAELRIEADTTQDEIKEKVGFTFNYPKTLSCGYILNFGSTNSISNDKSVMLSYSIDKKSSQSQETICLFVSEKPNIIPYQKIITQKTYSGIVVNVREDGVPTAQYSAHWKQHNLEFMIIGQDYNILENIARQIIDCQR